MASTCPLQVVEAVRAGQVEEVVAVTGPQSRGRLSIGDSVSDAVERKAFVARCDRKSQPVKEGDANAAMEAACRYLAWELGPKGIRVHAISPGPLVTGGTVYVDGGVNIMA